MLKPIIGITMYGKNAEGDYSLQSSYVKSVRDAGGIPLLLPPGESDPSVLLSKLDGVILAGGGDIEPEIYNGESHPAVYAVDPERDRFEIALAKLALSQNVPILGICRGLQVLNVADGGDLVPHVPDLFGTDIAHRHDHEEETKGTIHTVEVIADTKLAIAMGVTTAEVTSWHHQAILNVSPNWDIAAKAPDGVVEAIEHKLHPWAIAVQWHPEMASNDLSQQRLFQAIVAAAIKS
ncbi:putative glutamine amidotransferase [Synechococcus sp. PCC 7502]|uniref:gamma-glutamyl-gamma-aminobutyrate hydrolase family protein n=1 Tax=Synechococcus sp. PCC 7502 TaxID=1173263 RepID=UPI00029FDA0D|nr:gamma-glutamyl-gamma-aminobutyrate hydrolase family protein [Synechococcus sp. PCC 7502]AFY72556.1 putative glutamine amidotransferase [Synechococcus sp. PCC 7502]